MSRGSAGIGPCPGTKVSASSDDRILRAQPVEAVPVRNKQELFGEIKLAQIRDAILRNEDHAVASRVRPAQVQNLNLLAAEMERHAVPKGLSLESGLLFLRRHLLPVHQCEQIRPVVFVPDLQHIRVGHVAS